MIVSKGVSKKNNFFRYIYFYDNARSALKQVFKKYSPGYNLLLPGYIGYSSNEGSGLFDPVISERMNHSFYKVRRDLSIDIEDLQNQIRQGNDKKIVLLVHYFGVPDKEIKSIVELCLEYEAIIIEDAAHALFTDFIDGKCGRYGNYVIYSLHKMLPFNGVGGMLLTDSDQNGEFSEESVRVYPFFNYDLRKIADIRKKNAAIWNELLKEPNIAVRPLYSYRPDITYQTFPVIVEDGSRDKLYFGLNAAGYGVVSLYHEMVEPIKNMGLTDSLWLADHILNLPVHQDTNSNQIKGLFEEMLHIMGG